jgi:hypothetical protein
MRVLNFNTQASSAISGRSGAKLRVAVKDGVLFVRPTDRKASPHLVELKGSKSKGLSVEIADALVEKMGANSVIADASNFGLRPDKYGWFALTAAGAENNVEGAEVSVTSKEETPAQTEQTEA